MTEIGVENVANRILELRMPRYFFDVLVSENPKVPDEEGTVLTDLESARREADESIRDITVDALRSGQPINGLRIEIRDEEGAVLETVHGLGTR